MNVRNKDLRSAPNGIWNIKEIQGRNHAPKFCEKSCQLMSPIPAPHSVRHSSYEIISGGGGGGGKGPVVFEGGGGGGGFCSLGQHSLRLTADTHEKCVTKWSMLRNITVASQG